MKNAWHDEIAAAIASGHVFDDPVDLVGYRRDCSVVPGAMPGLAVRPTAAEELATVLRGASEHRVGVTVRGAGSMYAGGAAPAAADGLVVDTAGLNRILDIDTGRGIVVVEPGVRFGTLLAEIEPLGWTIGIVPSTAPTATVGGAVSAHALGRGSPRFQSMGDEVAGLEVVLADGTVLRTGSAASRDAGFFQRYCIGPDLTGLFLGADATLGIITKIALWLHRVPESRQTLCLGFPDYGSGAAFLGALQNREKWLGDIWYGAVYDRAAITGRMARLAPEIEAGALPWLAVGLDLRGDAEDLARTRSRIVDLAAQSSGTDFALFEARYFRTLCHDQNFWYSFAGYFSVSRCGLLMTSLPVERLASFLDRVQDWRQRFPQFLWGVGSVLCRRGLHGGVITFYDEARQWAEAQAIAMLCTEELAALGCVPYKSGKVWGQQIRHYDAYHATLRTIKRSLDPAGILGPGNLGL